MDISNIPVITVSYNAPELVGYLLASFRRFYSNTVYIIDGSEPEPLAKIREVVEGYENVKLIDFGYNIHHGPGMAWAIEHLPLSGPVLFLDTDIEFFRSGVIEILLENLHSGMYGVGGLIHVNRDGFNVTEQDGAVPYLLPSCMLCNIDVMRQWPLPIKHGNPMISAMLALHDAGESKQLGHLDWVLNDSTKGTEKVYFDHEGQGTVVRTGSYHLDEFMAAMSDKRAHDQAGGPDYGHDMNAYNRDLLAMIPPSAKRIVEVGCNAGSLAAAFKQINPECHYLGIELNASAAEFARKQCDAVMVMDIESVGADFFRRFTDVDCWVFGDVLEHMKDPWGLLSRIRAVIPSSGCIVACIPNAQHWSVIAKLCIGDFRYEDGGLLDRTHLRWFTRGTIFELFSTTGFKVAEGVPRIFNEPMREAALPAIRMMAQSVGANPDLAAQDALATQYVVRAVPVA